MPSSSDNRAPLALAWEWSSRVMAVSLEMVIPGLLGYGLDVWLGTVVLFTLLGFAFGGVTAVWHLIRMTSGKASDKDNGGPESPTEKKS